MKHDFISFDQAEWLKIRRKLRRKDRIEALLWWLFILALIGAVAWWHFNMGVTHDSRGGDKI